MLMYQMSRMSRDKGAVRHDDRIDAMAMGVQYFVDALAISAHRQISQRKHEEWLAMQWAFENDPKQATDALALGRSFTSLKNKPTTKVWDWV